MKKLLALLIVIFITTTCSIASVDKTSEEYLKSKKHVAVFNPLTEKIAETVIKKALIHETKGNYKVKFTGYNLSSMKKGIFKYLEITGRNVIANDIEIPYFNMKTITDYNWVDYNKNPVEFKSDMVFDCEMHLSEKSINDALKTEEYLKVIRKVNKRAYPLFTINDVTVRLKNDKMYIIMGYNFPISPKSKDRRFMVSSSFRIINGEIRSYGLEIDNAYGNLPLEKVANLINLINPLSFTVNIIDDKKCDGKIEDIKIQNDIVIVNGKMYIKGETKNKLTRS